MDIIDFEGRNVVFAENQPEYKPLYAFRDNSGQVVCCWKLTIKERIKLLFTGKIWHSILTFNEELQPQLLETDCPLNTGKELSQ